MMSHVPRVAPWANMIRTVGAVKELNSPERLTHYEAVELFIERARAVKADFTVTNENAPAVSEICVELDGLPLAIELAAARIRLLPSQKILSRHVWGTTKISCKKD